MDSSSHVFIGLRTETILFDLHFTRIYFYKRFHNWPVFALCSKAHLSGIIVYVKVAPQSIY